MPFAGTTARMPLVVPFSGATTWNVSAQFAAKWHWDERDIHELGSALVRRREAALDSLTADTEVTLLTIRFDGEIEPRDPVRISAVKGRLFRVYPGDVVFSQIDVRNGAIGVAPDDIPNMCVTSEFPVYQVDTTRADPSYIKLLFRTNAFMRLLNSMVSGASGRKRIRPHQLEKARVPLPSRSTQASIVNSWETSLADYEAPRDQLRALVRSLNAQLEQATAGFAQTCKSRFFVTSYSATRQWDIKAGRAAHLISSNPDFVRLGDYTEECTATVKPWEDPESDWPVYGVNNRDGVFLNSVKRGASFNAPYKRIENGWFFHNPTRANVGSLGIVLDVPDNAITSPEYQVWRLTGGYLPQFMALLITTEYFRSLVAFNRVGGVKQRMYYANLAEIRLPKIDLAEQQRIADTYTSLLGQVDSARAALANRKSDIENMIVGISQVGGI